MSWQQCKCLFFKHTQNIYKSWPYIIAPRKQYSPPHGDDRDIFSNHKRVKPENNYKVKKSLPTGSVTISLLLLVKAQTQTKTRISLKMITPCTGIGETVKAIIQGKSHWQKWKHETSNWKIGKGQSKADEVTNKKQKSGNKETVKFINENLVL